MRRRREKVYGKWMSHFEIRYMLRRASKAAAAGLGMTYKQWREGSRKSVSISKGLQNETD